MIKKAAIINVPEIQKYLRSSHKKFLKDVGLLSNKISQDHQLRLTRLVARITRVIECFVEEKIIDQFMPYNLPYADGDFVRCFCLKKKEFSDSIYLWTDGKIIVMGDSHFLINQNGCESIRNVNSDTFDGVEFAKILLDYIHRKIYSRRESYEQRIFGLTDDTTTTESSKEE